MTTVIVQPGASEATYQITVTINDTTYEVGATFGQGPRGPAGLDMKGTWDSDTAYDADDAVYYNGSSYWALKASTGVQPDTDDGTNWSLLAEKGEPGDVQGPTSSTDGHLAVWNGTSGSTLKDGGAPLALGTTSTTALAGDTTASDIGAAANTLGGAEQVTTPSATSGTVDLDCSVASVFTVTPTADITLSPSNVPAAGTACTITVIIGVGGGATVTMPEGAEWLGNTPSLTIGAFDTMLITMLTTDGGDTWWCTSATHTGTTPP